MSFFSKTRLKASQLFFDAFEYLQRTYDQAAEVFTPASPFGQLLTVVANLGEMIFYYIEAVATELNIFRARNIESIYGLSRLTGHDPTRGISARGIIGLRLNNNAGNAFSGDYVQILNGAALEVGNNSLSYFLRFDSDFIRLEKTNKNWINVELIQGEIDSQTFTGDGLPLQSYNLTTKEPTDQYMVTVDVDGQMWKKVDSLYDMGPGEKVFMCKTSVNGGLSIFFGNNQFGYLPPLGSIIRVTYVKTRGNTGNIGGKNLDIKFKDPGTDFLGEQVDLNEILSVNIVRNPNFGSDSEDPAFTRLIAPYQSNSFVLANPNNYIYYLSKYDFFSFINAYNTKDDQYINDDNIIYLFLVPDIKKKITSDKDYFTVPLEEFTLTEDEKAQVIETLNQSGRQVVTAEVRIDDPTVKKYVINIVLRWIEGYDKDALSVAIRNTLNDYFLTVNRRDRVPRSDLIAMIEDIEGIDSVNLFFLSQENEEAIRNGFYFVPVYGIDPATDQKALIENKKIVIGPEEDPQLGLDEFGDIVIGPNDIVVIRGGWEDRNKTYYEEIPVTNGIGSLNIFFKTMVESNLYNKTQQEKFDNLRRNRGTTIATGNNARSTNAGRLIGTSTQQIIKNQ
jgi:hypothetical protein